MTQEEILEYNKRCAEFLGKEYNDNKIVTPYTHFSGQNPTGKIWEECKFHSDWNWIMEVYDKICKLPSLGDFRYPETGPLGIFTNIKYNISYSNIFKT